MLQSFARTSNVDPPLNRTLHQPGLAVAFVAEGEIEGFGEHPLLIADMPFGPGIARDGDRAAVLAGMFDRGRDQLHVRERNATHLRFGRK